MLHSSQYSVIFCSVVEPVVFGNRRSAGKISARATYPSFTQSHERMYDGKLLSLISNDMERNK